MKKERNAGGNKGGLAAKGTCRSPTHFTRKDEFDREEKEVDKN